MSVTVDDVTKFVNLAKEILQVGIVLVPEGKLKDRVKKVAVLLDKPVATEVVVLGFKLVDEVKELLK